MSLRSLSPEERWAHDLEELKRWLTPEELIEYERNYKGKYFESEDPDPVDSLESKQNETSWSEYREQRLKNLSKSKYKSEQDLMELEEVWYEMYEAR